MAALEILKNVPLKSSTTSNPNDSLIEINLAVSESEISNSHASLIHQTALENWCKWAWQLLSRTSVLPELHLFHTDETHDGSCGNISRSSFIGSNSGGTPLILLHLFFSADDVWSHAALWSGRSGWMFVCTSKLSCMQEQEYCSTSNPWHLTNYFALNNCPFRMPT